MSETASKSPVNLVISIKYCADQCPDNLKEAHGHFAFVMDGEDLPISPPFASKLVGMFVIEMTLYELENEYKSIGSEIPPEGCALVNDIKLKMEEALLSANLPETADNDEETMDTLALGLELSEVANGGVLIIGDPAVLLKALNNDGEHERFDFKIDHGKYAVMHIGCKDCNTSMLGFFIDSRLRAEAEDVMTLERAMYLLDVATVKLEISAEDAAVLRAKLPELFPQSEPQKTPNPG